MKVRNWKCEATVCPIRGVLIMYEESETLENMMGAIRCLFCLTPMTPAPPPDPPSKQPEPN